MARILVVDDDSLTRATIVAALSDPERDIATADDGEQALRIAASFAPHLILTDVVMPRLDGWALVARLRERPETVSTAIIVLTALDSPAARVHALRSGAVDIVGKPIELDELELRVENALHYGARARRFADVALARGLAGNLAHVGLGSLLNMLSLDRKSGELRMTRGKEEARILLRDGAVVAASHACRDRSRGGRCVYELLRWDGGRFSFTEREIAATDEVGLSTSALLMEGARLQDEETASARGAA